MEMSIDTIIKDCEQSIKQSELFIKAHQKNMEIGEIKEYQYHIERDKLTADILRKYQKIEEIIKAWKDGTLEEKDSIYAFHTIMGAVEDENEY